MVATPASVESATCPFPHGEGAASHPTGAHPPLKGQDAGAHPALTGLSAAACPVAGVATELPAAAAATDPGSRVPAAIAPAWTPDAEAVVRERAEMWSHGDPTRGEELARGVAEERAAGRQAEITALFLRTLGKKLGYGHPLSEKGEELRFTWTPEAEARLADVPEFCRELTRWRVEWTAHKLGLGTTITPHEMEVKYELWGRVSHAIQEREREGLPWTDQAVDRFSRIPEFVRGQVLEAIEGNARSLGATEVDDAMVDLVIERWITTGDFHEGLYGFK
ncbi:MAG: PCP reductase family protein [Candidatus Dormibacteria bacterium]|jgi:hypothetical protein